MIALKRMLYSIFATTVLFVFPIGSVYSAENPDAVALVIGNRVYTNSRVPQVDFARRDALAFRQFLIDILGYRDQNIIVLHDATQAEMEGALGNGRSYQGKLWQLVKSGKSDLTVFYSGHGAPSLNDKKGYLLPIDVDPDQTEINGYPIDLLVNNLAKLDSKSVTIYIDACFSGDTPKGRLIRAASPISIVPVGTQVPSGMIMLTAGQGDQVASWDTSHRQGMFTYYLLEGLYGKADQPPFGTGDGAVTATKLKSYLDEEMSYAVKREFGRTQTASLFMQADRPLALFSNQRPVQRRNLDEIGPSDKGDDELWDEVKKQKNVIHYDEYLIAYPNGKHKDEAKAAIEKDMDEFSQHNRKNIEKYLNVDRR